jgi:hypothetical protein
MFLKTILKDAHASWRRRARRELRSFIRGEIREEQQNQQQRKRPKECCGNCLWVVKKKENTKKVRRCYHEPPKEGGYRPTVEKSDPSCSLFTLKKKYRTPAKRYAIRRRGWL